MAYNIGQLLFDPDKLTNPNNSNSYVTVLEDDEYSYQAYSFQNLTNSSNKQFYDYGICFKETLAKNNSYYIRFSIKTRSDSQQNISLKLKSQDGVSEREQFIKTFYINASLDEQDVYCETIVTPKDDSYNYLVWELQRISADYIEDDDPITQGDPRNGRIIKLDNLSISIVNPQNTVGTLKKIGVQARPSFLMCINGQEIRVGKSRIYEINNGVEIASIGFIPKDEKDFFIMDYEY